MTQLIVNESDFLTVSLWKDWLARTYPEGVKRIQTSSLLSNPPIKCYEAYLDGVLVSEYRIRERQENLTW